MKCELCGGVLAEATMVSHGEFFVCEDCDDGQEAMMPMRLIGEDAHRKMMAAEVKAILDSLFIRLGPGQERRSTREEMRMQVGRALALVERLEPDA